MKTLVTISLPRSGTNYFCATVGTLHNVFPMGEIFSPQGVMGLSGKESLEREFAPLIGEQGHRSPDLIAHFRSQPVEAVKRAKSAVSSITTKSVLSFKVFPDQVTEEDLEAMCRHHVDAAVILVRSRLDCYVSLLLARMTGEFHSHDTSQMTAAVEIGDFLSWAEEAEGWLRRQEAMLKKAGIPLLYVSYKPDVDVPTPVLQEKIYYLLRGLSLPATYPKARDGVFFKKQDYRSDIFSRVANRDELTALLSERKLMEHALRPFLSSGDIEEPIEATPPETPHWRQRMVRKLLRR